MFMALGKVRRWLLIMIWEGLKDKWSFDLNFTNMGRHSRYRRGSIFLAESRAEQRCGVE